jgi:translation initiation factor IF-3
MLLSTKRHQQWPQNNNPNKETYIASLDYRINDQISASEVRLIDEEGRQVGVVAIDKALAAAQDKNLDLIEIAPLAKPPVCKILDYGKMQYEAAKKEKEAKKKQHVIQVKEVRMRPKTDDHDLAFKVKQARKFIEQKNRVKFAVFFKGREMDHSHLGRDVLEKVTSMLEDIAKIETEIKMEGRHMTMTMSKK